MSDNWKGGFGTPPIANRFKPGQSGNPKGRPKKRAGDPLDIIMDVLTRPITIEVNGRSYHGPGIELVAKGVARRAASGNSRAVKLSADLTDVAYAWESKNIPSGQMEVFHIDEDGKRQPGRPRGPRRSK